MVLNAEPPCFYYSVISHSRYNPCPWKYADYYISWMSIVTVYLCMNPTYSTSQLCASQQHISSVQSMDESSQLSQARHRPSSFTTMSDLTVQPGAALHHQRLSECVFPGSKGQHDGFEVGKHVCVSHSSVCLCLPTLRQHTGWVTVCTHTLASHVVYVMCIAHTQPQTHHVHITKHSDAEKWKHTHALAKMRA